jgi:hypothetical protein
MIKSDGSGIHATRQKHELIKPDSFHMLLLSFSLIKIINNNNI